MKRLLLVPLIFGVAAPVKAGIYYYPACQDGIEVRSLKFTSESTRLVSFGFLPLAPIISSTCPLYVSS